jgi:hypothetical protein
MVIEGTEVRFRMEVWIAALIAAVTGFLGVVWATVQAASTRAVESAIDNANWSTKLGQELEKTRGVARQELRFQSYDRLWTALKPLALYSDEKVDRARIEKLSKDLSDWYFSALGGMYMTPHVREYYFALQDLLAAAARFPDWTATRTAGQEAKGSSKSSMSGSWRKRRPSGRSSRAVLPQPTRCFPTASPGARMSGGSPGPGPN